MTSDGFHDRIKKNSSSYFFTGFSPWTIRCNSTTDYVRYSIFNVIQNVKPPDYTVNQVNIVLQYKDKDKKDPASYCQIVSAYMSLGYSKLAFNLCSIFLESLHQDAYNQKKRVLKIIPEYETCIAFVLAKLIFEDTKNNKKYNTFVFFKPVSQRTTWSEARIGDLKLSNYVQRLLNRKVHTETVSCSVDLNSFQKYSHPMYIRGLILKHGNKWQDVINLLDKMSPLENKEITGDFTFKVCISPMNRLMSKAFQKMK